MAIDWDLVKILFCLFVAMIVVPVDEVQATEIPADKVFIVGESATVARMVLTNEQEIHVGEKTYFRCSYSGNSNFTSALKAEFTRTDGMKCNLYETLTIKMTPVLPNL